jgi:hypothetical protein
MSKRMVMKPTCIAITSIVCLLLIGCGKPTERTAVTAESPVSQGGETDPQFDWENPPASPPDRISTSFRSTKTLDQTTRWLERYAMVRGVPYSTEISEVGFRGCSMEWTLTTTPSYGVTVVARYSFALGQLDLKPSRVKHSSEGVRFGVADGELPVAMRYFENGKEKPSGTDHESSFRFPVRQEDHIGARISWALIHAARQCGAKSPTVE